MFEFIYSTKKRREIAKILLKRQASHNERIYLVTFLAYCGLSSKDIFNILDKHNRWDDYDSEYTEYQVRSLCKDINPSNYNKHLHIENKNRTVYCHDNSIFSKLNRDFFKDAVSAVYEYETRKYNYSGKVPWNPLKYGLYRTIEGKNGLLLYVDLDSNDIGVCYEVAKQVFHIDTWDYFKFSGGGFHLCRRTKLKEYADLFSELRDVYFSVKTNLVSFVLDSDCKKCVNLDPTSVRKRRLVRAYGINLKYNNYSIPVNDDMKFDEIIEISQDIEKIKKHLDEVIKHEVTYRRPNI